MLISKRKHDVYADYVAWCWRNVGQPQYPLTDDQVRNGPTEPATYELEPAPSTLRSRGDGTWVVE